MAVDSRDIGGSNQGGIRMNADIQGKLDAIKAPALSIVEAADALPALIDAQELVKYNEGFQAGKDSIQLPDPNDPTVIYTQAQMDAAVTAGKEQQRSEDQVVIDAQAGEIAALKVQLADMEALATDSVSKYATLKERVKQANADDAALIAEL